MIYIKRDKLEATLGQKINRNIRSLGVDTASRTGWAITDSHNDLITIDYKWIDIKTTDNNFKFNRMISIFSDIFKNYLPNIVIIEDTFLRFNVNVVKLLSRLGMIVYTCAYLSPVFCEKHFLGPSSARKNLGLKGNAKKEKVHEEFKEKFNIELEDPDIIDAIILSMNGIIPWVKKIKKKKKQKKKI